MQNISNETPLINIKKTHMKIIKILNADFVMQLTGQYYGFNKYLCRGFFLCERQEDLDTT